VGYTDPAFGVHAPCVRSWISWMMRYPCMGSSARRASTAWRTSCAPVPAPWPAGVSSRFSNRARSDSIACHTPSAASPKGDPEVGDDAAMTSS
jgi:hypothetical protein